MKHGWRLATVSRYIENEEQEKQNTIQEVFILASLHLDHIQHFTSIKQLCCWPYIIFDINSSINPMQNLFICHILNSTQDLLSQYNLYWGCSIEKMILLYKESCAMLYYTTFCFHRQNRFSRR
mmetsp:Transcript_49386/g.74549  ORF Transcript_49386/g.74549 Transcript_49386/m.74549 type:complete len:123 (+) Transcript_49386:90-458(+)